MIEALVFLPNLILIVWFCRNNIKLYQHRNQDFVQKRDLSLALGFNFAVGLMLIAATLTMTSTLYFRDDSIRTSAMIVSVLVTYLLVFFLNVKSWMIFYQYYWIHYALQSKWQQIINYSIIEEQTQSNWFIKNKSKYGLLSYVYRLFGIIHLILATIVSILVYLFITQEEQTELRLFTIFLMCSITVAVVVFYGVIVKKTQSFKDIYYIHRENKLIAKILIIGHIILLLFSGTLNYAFEDHPSDRVNRISETFAAYPMLFMWFAINYLSTIVVIKHNQDTEDCHNDNDEHSKLELIEVVTNEDRINTFMRYLSTELIISMSKYIDKCALFWRDIVNKQIFNGDFVGIYRIHTISMVCQE